MDSLTLYFELQKKYSTRTTLSIYQKNSDLITLLEQIQTEISSTPSNLNASPFLSAVEKIYVFKILDRKTLYKNILILDVYMILKALLSYIETPKSIDISYRNDQLCGLFINSKIAKNEIPLYSSYITNYLHLLRKKIQDTQNREIEKRNSLSEINETQSKQQNSIAKETISIEQEEKKRIQYTEKRIEQNRINVQLWHDEQAGINAKLLEIQPSVKQTLEILMSFSDNIINQYVMQFAKTQIELFDHIHDAYTYHKHRSKTCKQPDYINAVLNYYDFMDSIIDNLAVFGIEDITSTSGERFDGTIHETDSTSFTPKTATITQSVRTGFKYKDIIIQKEKVLI